MRCIVCGRTEDGVAKRSLEIATQINKAFEIITNKEEIEALLQRKKKFDRISFTHVTISDEVLKILEKYIETEKTDRDHNYLICMHCKTLVDTISYKTVENVKLPQFTGEQDAF
jgi:uncharacterized protein YpmS